MSAKDKLMDLVYLGYTIPNYDLKGNGGATFQSPDSDELESMILRGVFDTAEQVEMDKEYFARINDELDPDEPWEQYQVEVEPDIAQGGRTDGGILVMTFWLWPVDGGGDERISSVHG